MEEANRYHIGCVRKSLVYTFLYAHTELPITSGTRKLRQFLFFFFDYVTRKRVIQKEIHVMLLLTGLVADAL